jgi:hypothetical protein
MENTIRSDVFGLSSTKHLHRNAVLHPGNYVVMMWWLCHLISQWCWAHYLRPDSTVWPYHTYHIWPCQACQKYSCTVRSIGGPWQRSKYLNFDPPKGCRKPPRYVLYKCTYVPYNDTFSASDQGQMLDVGGSHPADVNAELVVTPDVTTLLRKIPWTLQDISIRISADLLGHMGWIQGWIQFNDRSVS